MNHEINPFKMRSERERLVVLAERNKSRIRERRNRYRRGKRLKKIYCLELFEMVGNTYILNMVCL
mgnify:CR=1 FL=1